MKRVFFFIFLFYILRSQIVMRYLFFFSVQDVIPPGAVVLSANGTPFIVQNGLAFCANPETYAVTHPGVKN